MIPGAVHLWFLGGGTLFPAAALRLDLALLCGFLAGILGTLGALVILQGWNREATRKETLELIASISRVQAANTDLAERVSSVARSQVISELANRGQLPSAATAKPGKN